MNSRQQRNAQQGLSLVEVLVAAVLLVLALVPAVNSLHGGLTASGAAAGAAQQHYAVLALSETVLAEPYGSLLTAAAVAGDAVTPTAYSDAAGATDRRVVFVALYDADDVDSDGDPFTVVDADLDGDGNPYTGFDGLLWLRVELQGSVIGIESLVAP